MADKFIKKKAVLSPLKKINVSDNINTKIVNKKILFFFV